MINSTDNNIRVVPTVCHGFAVQFSFPSLAMGTDSCIRIADIKKNIIITDSFLDFLL